MTTRHRCGGAGFHLNPDRDGDSPRPIRLRMLVLASIAVLLTGCTGTTTTPARSGSASSGSQIGIPTTSPAGSTGGGSSPGITAPEPLPISAPPSSPSVPAPTAHDSRAAFITAADAVCSDAGHRLAAVPAPTGPADLVDTLKAQLQIQRDTLAGLERLSPPEEDRADITARMLDPYRDAIGRQQALLPAIENVVAAGDHVQLATMHTEYDAAGHPQSVATFVRDYGFHSCQSFEYFRITSGR